MELRQPAFPYSLHLLVPAPVRPIEALSGIRIGSSNAGAHVAGRLLRSNHLGLESRRIGINPLQLSQVAVQNTDNLAQLLFEGVSVSHIQEGKKQNIPDHQACYPCSGCPTSH